MSTELKERFLILTADLKTDWEICANITPRMPVIREEQRNDYEQLLDQGLQKAYRFLDQYHKISHKSWLNRRKKLVRSLLENDSLFIAGHMNEQMKKQLLQLSVRFIRDARAFDSTLSLSDIGQAMRNVWICAILQMLFCKEVHYSKAIFGYSMLYPYTDNLLDDEALTQADKQHFNERFYERLKGHEVSEISAYEKRVFDLIADIESVYDRKRYPDVYESLYLIMEGQIRSLTQQTKTLSKEELLRISIEKGAASVVADGYLVCGTMDQKQLWFCMRYGFMLQLSDDLQDIEDDRKNRHRTLFSTVADGESLDLPVMQLLAYTEQLMNEAACDEETKSMIIDNSTLLIYLSVLSKPDRFRPAFTGRCAQAMPIHIDYIKNTQEQWAASELGQRITRDESYMMELLDAVLQ